MRHAARSPGYRIADESLMDDVSRRLIDQIEQADGPSYTELTPGELRAGHESFFRPLALEENGLASIAKTEISRPDGSPMRLWIYRPKGAPDDEKLPVLVYCHGGGMMVGSLEIYDTILQRLCAKSGVAIASVDYRLAPEFTFPAAHEDCYLAVRWIIESGPAFNLDAGRVAVGGDSGGGLLAASASRLAAAGRLPPLRFQLLIYPFLGRRHDYASYTEFQDGYFGSTRQLDWFIASYLNFPDELGQVDFSPILASDFARLPATFVITAGYDMLRDEAEHYVGLLQAAGVPARFKRYPTTFHPFLNAAGVIPAGRQAIDDCVSALRAALFQS